MIMSNDAFLILFLILIGLMTIIPLFLRKFKIPDVIALLLVGMLIGPNGFDLLGRLTPLLSFLGTKSDVVEAHSLTLINSLGSLGLLFLMTLAGMEADFKLIRNSRRPVIALSVLTFLIPSVSGYRILQGGILSSGSACSGAAVFLSPAVLQYHRVILHQIHTILLFL